MNCKTIEDCLACSEHQYCSNNKAKYVIKLQKRIEELEKKVGFLEKEMVIEALKGEPCEDCVSRTAVIELAKKGTLISNGNFKSVCEAINNLPRVYPTLPTMVYPQVLGVTPCVVPDYKGGWKLAE